VKTVASTTPSALCQYGNSNFPTFLHTNSLGEALHPTLNSLTPRGNLMVMLEGRGRLHGYQNEMSLADARNTFSSAP
jgi:hypothetical protein